MLYPHVPHLHLVAARADVFVDLSVTVLARVAALVVLVLAVCRVDRAGVPKHIILVTLAQAADLTWARS